VGDEDISWWLQVDTISRCKVQVVLMINNRHHDVDDVGGGVDGGGDGGDVDDGDIDGGGSVLRELL
jgi:hypothetical protein